MKPFRRKPNDHAVAPAPAPAKTPAPRPSGPARQTVLAPHVERALISLTTKMQQFVERIEALERRVDELAESTVHAPSHSDVLEVRMHSAKLAAELARSTVELRGEIGMASDEARRAARLARTPALSPDPYEMPTEADLQPVAGPSADIAPAGDAGIDPDEAARRRRWSASA